MTMYNERITEGCYEASRAGVPGVASGQHGRNTHFSNPNKDNTGYEGDR